MTNNLKMPVVGQTYKYQRQYLYGTVFVNFVNKDKNAVRFLTQGNEQGCSIESFWRMFEELPQDTSSAQTEFSNPVLTSGRTTDEKGNYQHVSEVERAKDELREKINYINTSEDIPKFGSVRENSFRELRGCAQNLLNALDGEKDKKTYHSFEYKPYDTDKAETKLWEEIKRKYPKPEKPLESKSESIWKDVSNLQEEASLDVIIRCNLIGHCFATWSRLERKLVIISPSEHASFINLESVEEYCTLTDFINSFEDLQERVRKLEEGRNA